jgi:hypothetical protein
LPVWRFRTDNVLHVYNNGSGGDDDDECSDLGKAAVMVTSKLRTMAMAAMALVMVAMVVRTTAVTAVVMANLRL